VKRRRPDYLERSEQDQAFFRRCSSHPGRVPRKRTSRNVGTAPRSDPYAYLLTWQGFLYLAVIIDAWSRRAVGWSMATHLRTELVLDALEMALWNCRPAPRLIHHSDSEYLEAGRFLGS
jgi:transposase InsO family protein